MSTRTFRTIKAIITADRAQRLDIVLRNDGIFQVFEQIPVAIGEDEWQPGKVWGSYETAEMAERAAQSYLAAGSDES